MTYNDGAPSPSHDELDARAVLEEHARDVAGPEPLLREVPPADPYPVASLGPVRPVAEAIQRLTQAPAAIAAQSALGVAALAVQGHADVETLAGPRPCSLFLLTIAKSGERKSTCDRLAMGAVRGHERELSDLFKREAQDHEAAREVWAKQRAHILSAAASDPSAARLELSALGPEPEPPLRPWIVASDPTLEGLTKNLPVMRPVLGIFSDEGGGFFGGYGMGKDHRLKTVAGLSAFWDGAPINRTRGGDGVDTFHGRRLSAHLMAQPVAVAELLADPIATQQGFLARFLTCDPPSTIGTRFQREADPADQRAVAAFAAHLGDILATDAPLREDTRNELEPRFLPLAPDARAVLSAFADALERAQGQGGELVTVTPFASKAAEHAARIAGVVTLFSDLGADAVTGETMRDAVALAQHYVGEAKRLTDAAVIPPAIADAEALRLWLVETWPGAVVSRPDILQRGPNKLRNAKAAGAAMAELVKMGWLEKAGPGVSGGKPRKVTFRVMRGAS